MLNINIFFFFTLAQLQQMSSNPEVTAKLRQEKELFDQAVRQKVADLVHLRIVSHCIWIIIMLK